MSIAKSDLQRCLICHSLLIEPYINLAQVAEWLKQEGIIDASTVISENNSDLRNIVEEGLQTLGIYVWHNDPIKTNRGLAGRNYKGFQDLLDCQIKELQEARKQQEIDGGIEESERTSFTSILSKSNISKKHVRELRQSTEKILGIDSSTSESDRQDILEIYFNYDEDGNELGTQEYEQSKTNKKEWKRINRILPEHSNEPYLPITLSDIYALDMEELRCPLLTGWYDDFTLIAPEGSQIVASSCSVGNSGANFDPDSDSENYYETLDLTDFKTTQLINPISSRVGASHLGNSDGSGSNFATASASQSSYIDRKKPIKIQFTNSSLSTGKLTILSYVLSSATGMVQLTHQSDKFQNPSPHPNINILDGKKAYFDLTGTWALGNHQTYWYGTESSTFNIGVIIGVYKEGGGSLQCEFAFDARIATPYWFGNTYWQPLVSGRNFMDFKSYFDHVFPEYEDTKKYFCRYISMTFNTSTTAYLWNPSPVIVRTLSSSVNVNAVLSKLGIT